MQVLMRFYARIVITQPKLTLLGVGAIVIFFALAAQKFWLDASADSLLLEQDTELRYYRGVQARYGSDDYLIITYHVERDLFDPRTLADIGELRDELVAMDGLSSVTTMLDVPLIESPPVSLQDLQEEVPNLSSARTDIELARRELTESPLYRQLIMSPDGRTTALLARLRRDPVYDVLLGQRDTIRERQLVGRISADEQGRLDALNQEIKKLRVLLTQQQRADIATVREILDRHRNGADIRLGGLAMIVTDMLDFIRHDIAVFGIGILIFLIGLLMAIFSRLRWVVLSMLCCFSSVVIVTGYLGLANWPVTVVSANFVALLLIFSLSITVHLIVRYRELHEDNPDQTQRWLVTNMVRDKFIPCLFTATTTMVAFASLIVSGVRPVIDFGWMMTIGMFVVMIMAFTLFPAGLMMFAPGKVQRRNSTTAAITQFFARLVERRARLLSLTYALVGALSLLGITWLSVDNRFIDNFKSTTEIYQGMVMIDRELGGTTPFDVILEADPAFFESKEEVTEDSDDEFKNYGDDALDDEFADELDDLLNDEYSAEEGDLGSTSYWYNAYQLENVAKVHAYLESLPQTGKVLSLATTIDTLRAINDNQPPSTFWMSLLYKRLPDSVKASLFDPYMSSDGNQVRFAVRVFESDPNLQRDVLVSTIRQHLINEMGFTPERVHVTGMLVLYNNLLQSLYRSQILTIGFVFLAIMVMFLFLYRSLKIALITMVPNVLGALFVVGMMGLLSIPLDIMTITIAAIVIGIGVDDSIHYLHRFREEFRLDRDYEAAMQRSHGSIGRAMYYTSIIVTAGFSILVLSSFIPTIYFGLLTGFAMIFAMVANLTLLPLLLVRFKPLGAGFKTLTMQT
jgi:predicted RND superfamily exporter protein